MNHGRDAHGTKPLVLIETVASRQLVVCASEGARAAGIRRGMTLTQARALCARLEWSDHDPDADARALESLGRWLMRFSPVVAIDASETPDVLHHAVFLDVGGCERLFGGLDKLLARLRAALRQAGLSAGAAIAPTPGAAWALASTSGDGTLITQEQLPHALSPLPPASLRLEPATVAMLHHLGVETVGQLLRLPREQLPARFGSHLLLRIDQALGRVTEPLAALPHVSPVRASREFDGVINAPEAVWLVFRDLLDRVIADLVRRGCGARRLEVEFRQQNAGPIRKAIQLSKPSRNAASLFNLMRCALETVGERRRHEGTERTRHEGTKARRHEVGREGRRQGVQASALPASLPSPPLRAFVPSCLRASVSASASASLFLSLDTPGFTGISLSVPLFEPLSEEQILLADAGAHAAGEELDRLIEVLRVRIGSDAVARAMLVESHLPERAYRFAGPGEPRSPSPTRRTLQRRRPSPGSRRKKTEDVECWASPNARPLHLLPRPLELRVIASPSDEGDGPPLSFTLETELGGRVQRRVQRRVHRLVHAVGPERVGGVWWEGHEKTRDYYDVEDENGKRFWLFRVLNTGRWFLHGEFE